jgi:hypothetical protein
MRRHQRGVTALGWLILMVPMALVAYVGIRLTPVYLNYMNVSHALTQVSTELTGDMDVDHVRLSLEKHFDVNGITFPDPRDIKVTRMGHGWNVEANYDDQTPLFGNVFILVSFDKSVKLKSAADD